MSDYKLPDLPSDEDLGITDEDREALQELPEDRPEMSAEEMSSLLGKMFSPKGEDASEAPSDPKAEKKRKKLERKEAKRRKRKRESAAAGPHGATGKTRATEPARRRSRWRGPGTLAVLVLAAAVSSTKTGLPRPVPANAPDTAFSSSRAMSVLIEIATTPHPTGSPEHTRVREFLTERLRLLGLETEVQTTTALSPLDGVSRAATVRNIVARIPGTAPTGAILVTAHYDSQVLTPGAGDDGSGVVAILEAIRALQAGAPLRNDVIVLLTDAEELGLMGVQAFIEEHRWMQDVSVLLAFEMRGAGGPSIMFQTNAENGWVVRALKEAVPRAFANSLSDEVYRRMPNFTDFTPLKQAGVQGLMFAAIDNARVYHEASDTPENLDESSLQHHGLHALGLLRYLGAADLTNVDAPSVVAFHVPLVGLIVHGQGWVLPLAGAVLLILIGAMLIAIRRGERGWAVLVGLGLASVGSALGYGAGNGLFEWLSGRHAESGSLSGAVFHGEGWYVVALACGLMALVTTVHGIARRWLSVQELALGALVLPAGVATWLSFAMPLGAPNLQWPALAAALSVLIIAALGTRASATVGWTVTLLLALPAIALLVPLTELLWFALTFGFAGVLGVMIVAILLLMLPAIDALRYPNAWWAPLTALTIGAGTLALGLLASSPDADSPAPSTLVYAYEHGSPEGIWATDIVRDSSDLPARDWAVSRAGSAFASTLSLEGFGYLAGDVPVTAGPVVDAPPLTMVLQSDTTTGGLRRVTLGVRSEIGAEMLRFQRDPRFETRLRSINGKAIDGEWFEHWGVPDTLVALEIEMPAGSAIGIEIVEHMLRPEEVLGPDTFERPADLAPNQSRMSDRVMIKTSFQPRTPPEVDGETAPGAAPETSRADPDTAGTVPDTIRP